MDGIGKAGGSPGKPLLDDQVIFSQFFSQKTGPAFIFVKTPICPGTVAVCVGITQTDNMFFHRKDNLLCVGNVLKTVQISLFIANSIAFFRKKSNKIKENFFFLFIIDKNHFRMYNGFINNDAAAFDVL